MKNMFKICICFMIMSTLFCFLPKVFSASSTSADEMWESASSWFKDVDKNEYSDSARNIINEFVTMVNIIGTSVISIATIVLGIKYMFGSVSSKADVKESMITLLIACVFFFGWANISSIILSGNELFLTNANDTSYKPFIGRTFNLVVYILQIAAIIGVIYVGIRYIFAGASGKADLKSKSPYFIMGVVLTFSAVTFLTTISSWINQLLS